MSQGILSQEADNTFNDASTVTIAPTATLDLNFAVAGTDTVDKLFKMHRRSPGFTMVELLVTTSIIIILAVLAFLGMKTWRASADMTVSMGRIRTLGIANISYASDNKPHAIQTSGMRTVSDGKKIRWKASNPEQASPIATKTAAWLCSMMVTPAR